MARSRSPRTPSYGLELADRLSSSEQSSHASPTRIQSLSPMARRRMQKIQSNLNALAAERGHQDQAIVPSSNVMNLPRPDAPSAERSVEKPPRAPHANGSPAVVGREDLSPSPRQVTRQERSTSATRARSPSPLSLAEAQAAVCEPVTFGNDLIVYDIRHVRS